MIKVPMPLIVSKDRARALILPCPTAAGQQFITETTPSTPAETPVGSSRLFVADMARSSSTWIK